MRYVVELQERQRAASVMDGEPRWKFLAAGGRRLAVAFAVLMLSVAPILMPSGGGIAYADVPVRSIWAIEHYPDCCAPLPIYGLEILSSSLPMRFGPGSLITTFTAKYVNVLTPRIIATSNTSKFVGEIAIREGEAIHIRQSFDLSGYIAYHSGLKVRGKDRYEGRYYDNAGYQGDFVLRRIR